MKLTSTVYNTCEMVKKVHQCHSHKSDPPEYALFSLQLIQQ